MYGFDRQGISTVAGRTGGGASAVPQRSTPALRRSGTAGSKQTVPQEQDKACMYGCGGNIWVWQAGDQRRQGGSVHCIKKRARAKYLQAELPAYDRASIEQDG
jgi:hypothetical protein